MDGLSAVYQRSCFNLKWLANFFPRYFVDSGHPHADMTQLNRFFGSVQIYLHMSTDKLSIITSHMVPGVHVEHRTLGMRARFAHCSHGSSDHMLTRRLSLHVRMLRRMKFPAV